MHKQERYTAAKLRRAAGAHRLLVATPPVAG